MERAELSQRKKSNIMKETRRASNNKLWDFHFASIMLIVEASNRAWKEKLMEQKISAEEEEKTLNRNF